MNIDITRRVKIVTGLKCNIRCVFCYYRDQLNAPNREKKDIIRDLKYAYNSGIREVDFSGGEPTIHPDLQGLIREAKNLGMERVCIISNGWRLADISFMRALRDAGLDEILFSLHGASPEIHDKLTDTPGSFQRITKAMENAVEESVAVRINTVVNGLNVKTLQDEASYILRYTPLQVNFITLNDWCYAKQLVDTLMIRYSEMASALKGACDILSPSVAAVNVRYIPFCFMKDYERFVCNHKQVKFDLYEWRPWVRSRLEVQNNLFRCFAIAWYGFFSGRVFMHAFRMKAKHMLDESIIEALRHWFYVKHSKCRDCRFDLICDGVEKTYFRKFGLEELSPQPGEKIKDAVFFRKIR